ncbi:unnamed protein product [Rhizopus microsporus]
MLTSILAGFITTTLFNIAKAAGTEDIFELQPEIHHVFRPNENATCPLFSTLLTHRTLSLAHSNFWLVKPWLYTSKSYVRLCILQPLEHIYPRLHRLPCCH